MKKTIFILTCLLAIYLVPEYVFAGDPHHDHHATTNITTIKKIIDTNGLAAIYATTQIHPSENISGIQLGGGIAQVNGRTGVAFGVPGRAMFNGSVAKEGDETFVGFGFNLSIKP